MMNNEDKKQYLNDVRDLLTCSTRLESTIVLIKSKDNYKKKHAKKDIELQQDKFSKIVSKYDVGNDKKLHDIVNRFTADLILAKELIKK